MSVRGLHHLYSFSFRNLYDIHHFLLLLLLFQDFFFLSFFLSFYLFIFLVRRRAAPPGLWLLSKLMRRIRFFFSFGWVAVRIWREDRDAELRPITFIHMCVLLYIMHSFFFSSFLPPYAPRGHRVFSCASIATFETF